MRVMIGGFLGISGISRWLRGNIQFTTRHWYELCIVAVRCAEMTAWRVEIDQF